MKPASAPKYLGAQGVCATPVPWTPLPEKTLYSRHTVVHLRASLYCPEKNVVPHSHHVHRVQYFPLNHILPFSKALTYPVKGIVDSLPYPRACFRWSARPKKCVENSNHESRRIDTSQAYVLFITATIDLASLVMGIFFPSVLGTNKCLQSLHFWIAAVLPSWSPVGSFLVSVSDCHDKTRFSPNPCN